MLADADAKPVYVASDSPVRAGSLWYLFFRRAEFRSDEVARVRAGQLGLPAATDSAEATEFWLAVQQVLAAG